VQEVNR